MSARYCMIESAKNMTKLFLLLITLFVFTGAAFAAVNINTATQQELQTLSGITSAKARAIIEYRSKAGKFRTAEDLTKVDGLNPRYLDMKQLYKDVSVAGPTVLKVGADK